MSYEVTNNIMNQKYKNNYSVSKSFHVVFVFVTLYLIPSASDAVDDFGSRDNGTSHGEKYAVIFDVGSSGSRVHVFRFDNNLNLLTIGNNLELFAQVKPGLSAYAKNPKDAASSLWYLLMNAERAVPKDLRPETAVRVGVTAGSRQLGGEAFGGILQSVRDYLKENSKLKSKSEWVTVLDGSEACTYQWMSINYLLGNLGKPYPDTVGVVDLGGGSLQMAYTISENDAANAPKLKVGNDSYVKQMQLKGTKYYLYVHSYLNYGLVAARGEILKSTEDYGSPCVVPDYNGLYRYQGKVYKVAHSSSGSSKLKCWKVVAKALKLNAPCPHKKCTFDGVWNGGVGAGYKNLYIASFFYDKADQAGFIDTKNPVAKVRPVDFGDAATRVCKTSLKEAKSIYPKVEPSDLPFLCMDLVYQFTLLVHGFGLNPGQEITLVKQIKYQNSLVEAAWPLGSAIDFVSMSFDTRETF